MKLTYIFTGIVVSVVSLSILAAELPTQKPLDKGDQKVEIKPPKRDLHGEMSLQAKKINR